MLGPFEIDNKGTDSKPTRSTVSAAGSLQVNERRTPIPASYFPEVVRSLAQKRQPESRSSNHLEFRPEFKLRGGRIIKRGIFEPPFHSIPLSHVHVRSVFPGLGYVPSPVRQFQAKSSVLSVVCIPLLVSITSSCPPKSTLGQSAFALSTSNSSFFCLWRREAKLIHWLCSRSRVCRNLSWNTTDDALRQVSADYSRDQKMALCYVVSFVSE